MTIVTEFKDIATGHITFEVEGKRVPGSKRHDDAERIAIQIHMPNGCIMRGVADVGDGMPKAFERAWENMKRSGINGIDYSEVIE